MLKSFFNNINSFLEHTHYNYAEHEIPEKLITSPTFKNYRLFLSTANHWLMLANTIPKEYSPKIYYYTLLLSFVGFGLTYLYAKIKEAQQGRFPLGLKNSSFNGLRYVTSKFVLYNNGLTDETAKIIQRLCERDRVQYQIMNALAGLLSNKTIVTGAEDLSKRNLHSGLLYEDFIYQPFKNLIIRQLRSEDRRKDLLALLKNFCKSDVAQAAFVTNLSYAFENQGVKDMFAYSNIALKKFSILDILQYARSMLDDPKSKEIAKQKLLSYLEG